MALTAGFTADLAAMEPKSTRIGIALLDVLLDAVVDVEIEDDIMKCAKPQRANALFVAAVLVFGFHLPSSSLLAWQSSGGGGTRGTLREARSKLESAVPDGAVHHDQNVALPSSPQPRADQGLGRGPSLETFIDGSVFNGDFNDFLPAPQQHQARILLLDHVQLDRPALAAAHSADLIARGLHVGLNIEDELVNRFVRKLTMTAVSADIDSASVGWTTVRREIYLVSHSLAGMIAFATSDVEVVRASGASRVNFTLRFSPNADDLANKATGFGGLIIEQWADVPLDQNGKASREWEGINPQIRGDVVSWFRQRVRVTNSVGSSIVFSPNEFTAAEAFAQMGATCTSCYSQCQLGFPPLSPLLLYCIVDTAFDLCRFPCATPCTSCCAGCVAFVIVWCVAGDALFDFVMCLIQSCWLNAPANAAILPTITQIAPNPVDANAPLTIAATAHYDYCGDVESATVTITLGNSQWITQLVDGSFNQQIYAPSSPGNYTINVTVSDGTLSGATSASISVIQEGGSQGCGYNLQGTWVVYDYDVPSNTWWSKDSFRTTDEFVDGLIYVVNLGCPVTLKWKFYYPNGNQYGSDLVWPVGSVNPTPNWYWWSWGFLIDGNAMSYTLGRYRVKMYINSGQGFQLVGNKRYVIGWDYEAGLLCRNLSGDNPTGVTDVFFQADARVYTWNKVVLVAQDTELRCRFYEPNGTLYLEVTSPEYNIHGPPGSNDWYDWYKSWAWIGVTGNQAAQRCGLWTTQVQYRNPTSGAWQTMYQDDFEILEAPNVPPTASITPSAVIPNQSIVLNVFASDNTYLRKVDVHWWDGMWHMQTIGDNINASTKVGTVPIGSFAAGDTFEFYAVAVDTSGNAVTTALNSVVVPPTNNTCANAIMLGVGSASYSTLGATTDGPDEGAACAGSNPTQIGSDVWYKFTAPCTGVTTVSLCESNFDARVAIYSSCPTGIGQTIVCNDDFCAEKPQVTFGSTSGSQYVIRIGGANGATGSGIMLISCTPPPANDLCSNALLKGIGSHAFSTLGASTDGLDEPGLCNFDGETHIRNDVWFKYLAQCTGFVTVSLCGSNFDTKLAAYSACPSAPGQVLACNDNSCGNAAEVSFPVNSGTVYRVRVGSPNGTTGTGTMVISCTPVTPTGACCGSDGTCTGSMTQANCQSTGGTYQGNNTLCSGVECPQPCLADITADGIVNVNDLLTVINTWGPCSGCAADITGDGMVNVNDLLAVINIWGPCP